MDSGWAFIALLTLTLILVCHLLNVIERKEENIIRLQKDVSSFAVPLENLNQRIIDEEVSLILNRHAEN